MKHNNLVLMDDLKKYILEYIFFSIILDSESSNASLKNLLKKIASTISQVML